ncbi:MAG: universal stress protein [Dehalococcoidia bacterium]|nr:MAG: universal stress protein [Dehalococcoidia bacterium]
MSTELDAEIYLARVVVWIEAFSGLRFDPDILRMMEDAKRYLGELASRFDLPVDRTVPIVRYGDNTAKQIITVAEDEDIDLIIMGGRCKSWLQRLAKGSVYWGVVRSRVCPVCVVPFPERKPAGDIAQWRRREPPMRILMAVDGSDECEESLRVAATWVRVLKADVYLLQVIDRSASTGEHVHREPEREGGIEAEVPVMTDEVRTYLDELASRLKLPADRTVTLVRRGDDPAKVISTIAEDEGVDLVVMSTHCRGWFGELTQGSVCSDVIRSRVCPVLCVPLPLTEPRRQPWGVLTGRR